MKFINWVKLKHNEHRETYIISPNSHRSSRHILCNRSQTHWFGLRLVTAVFSYIRKRRRATDVPRCIGVLRLGGKIGKTGTEKNKINTSAITRMFSVVRVAIYMPHHALRCQQIRTAFFVFTDKNCSYRLRRLNLFIDGI